MKHLTETQDESSLPNLLNRSVQHREKKSIRSSPSSISVPRPPNFSHTSDTWWAGPCLGPSAAAQVMSAKIRRASKGRQARDLFINFSLLQTTFKAGSEPCGPSRRDSTAPGQTRCMLSDRTATSVVRNFRIIAFFATEASAPRGEEASNSERLSPSLKPNSKGKADNSNPVYSHQNPARRVVSKWLLMSTTLNLTDQCSPTTEITQSRIHFQESTRVLSETHFLGAALFSTQDLAPVVSRQSPASVPQETREKNVNNE